MSSAPPSVSRLSRRGRWVEPALDDQETDPEPIFPVEEQAPEIDAASQPPQQQPAEIDINQPDQASAQQRDEKISTPEETQQAENDDVNAEAYAAQPQEEQPAPEEPEQEESPSEPIVHEEMAQGAAEELADQLCADSLQATAQLLDEQLSAETAEQQEQDQEPQSEEMGDEQIAVEAADERDVQPCADNLQAAIQLLDEQLSDEATVKEAPEPEPQSERMGDEQIAESLADELDEQAGFENLQETAQESDEEMSAEEPQEDGQIQFAEEKIAMDSSQVNNEQDLSQSSNHEIDPATERFFSQPPRVGLDNPILWEDFDEAAYEAKQPQYTMYIIYAMVGLAVLGIGGVYIYSSLSSDSTEAHSETVKEKIVAEASAPKEELTSKPQDVLKPNPEPSGKNEPLGAEKPPVEQLQEPAPPVEEGQATLNPEQPAAEEPQAEQMQAPTQEPAKDQPQQANAADGPGAKTEEKSDSPQQPGEPEKEPAEPQPKKPCCKNLKELEQALKDNPNDSEILGKLAFFYLNKGKNKEAEQYAQNTVDIDPKNSLGWIVLGASRDAQRNRKGAQEAYQQCVKLGEGKYVLECRRMVR